MVAKGHFLEWGKISGGEVVAEFKGILIFCHLWGDWGRVKIFAVFDRDEEK